MQIVINKAYFDNIKIAIDAMNNFFASGFKTKDFPVVNNDFQLDRILSRTLSWLNNIEPSWVDDPNKAIETLDTLKSIVSKETVKEAVEEVPPDPENPWVRIISGEDKTASDMFHAFIGFKVLQYITNNFDKYEQLMNGIYSFELFTKPSSYRDAITVFTSPIPMPELDSIAKLPGEYKLFDASDYVNSIFANEQIKLPEDMNSDTEIQRFQSFGDLQDCEIVINDAVQEAAKVDYFTEAVEGIRFYKGKWKISKQFESSINELLKRLRECETTEDLAELFQTAKINPMAFRNAVVPAILVRVFANPKKVAETDKDEFKDYTKSYASIVRQNEGAKRFSRVDLFSTFKADKEGTIQFLEDFFKLNLANNENIVVSNNTILTTFNIFDSHIYFTVLYNAMDDKHREAETCDGFIKRIRSRINKNSHAANPYQKKKETKKSIEGSAQVAEYAFETLKELGELSVADMHYCESFAGAVYDEIDTMGDAFYNKGMSSIMVDHYIGESYQLFQEADEEPEKNKKTAAEDGSIPNYLKSRVNISDESSSAKAAAEKKKKKSSEVSDITLDPDDEFTPEVPEYMKNRMDDAGDIDPTITDVQLPPDVPTNDADMLADSIEARLNTDADSLSDMLGADYKGQIKPGNQGGPGTVIYNITNNYTNSHNSTVTNDLSNRSRVSNVTSTNNDLSSNKRTSMARKTPSTNNYDNTRPSSNSKEPTDTFSTGKSVQEVFALLGSKEPLFVESDAGTPPKGDLLTTAMDVDKATLPAQQGLKRGVQKVVNTGKAIVKPIGRTKQWMRNMVDSLIKRDEDKVKADLIENPSYRSAVYKVARLAIKTGATAVFYAVSPWLGVGYLGVQGAKLVDRDRLRKEANQEIATEIQIINEKIEHLRSGSRWGNEQTEEQRQELYKLMRMRQKLVGLSTSAHKQKLANPKSVY